jgi:putative ABC transport system permease protein
LLESFSRLNALDPGFRPAHLLVAQVHLPRAKYSAVQRTRDFFDQLLQRVRSVPGVVAAGAGSQLPFGGFSSGVGFEIPSHPTDEGQSARWTAVTPGYFSTMQIPLVAGRFFNDHDDAASERVCIINEDVAKRFPPGQNPIGQIIDTADVRGLRVVGLVRQVKYWKLNDEAEPEVYQPEWQVSDPRMSVVVRTTGDPLSVAAALREQVWSLDKDQPVAQIQSYEQLISDRSAATRLNTQLMAIFAMLGLALAATGIYGMIAYSVSQQTRDIGIRMALGANSRDASWMMAKQALIMVLQGLGLGIIGALAAGHVLVNMLYATKPTDPRTYAVVTGVLLSVACLSAWVPARRASQVDPMTVLRHE